MCIILPADGFIILYGQSSGLYTHLRIAHPNRKTPISAVSFVTFPPAAYSVGNTLTPSPHPVGREMIEQATKIS